MDERATLEAIAFFEDIKEEYSKKYLAQGRVSLAQVAQYEKFLANCKWSIDSLKNNLK